MRAAELHARGELVPRAEAAVARLAACDLCPRNCGVDRAAGQTGFCGIGRKARIASYHLHLGEETPLVGEVGSGTIFFAGCNLGCVFCQNADISQPGDMDRVGLEASPEELAGVMLELERQGAANINLVTPSHVAAQILEALPMALDNGLNLPLVWNTSAYDEPDTLRLLDGVVDIYMPDAKIWDPDTAARLLQARDYPDKARAAIAEMHRQAGDLDLDQNGLAASGLLVRHLVMPNGLAGTGEWMDFLAELSKNTYLNLMDQYRPCHKALEHEDLARPITGSEMRQARSRARDAGLTRLDRSEERISLLFKHLLH